MVSFTFNAHVMRSLLYNCILDGTGNNMRKKKIAEEKSKPLMIDPCVSAGSLKALWNLRYQVWTLWNLGKVCSWADNCL